MQQLEYKPLLRTIIMVIKDKFTALDYEILSRAKIEMARENVQSYSDYFLKTKNNELSASSPSGSSNSFGRGSDSHAMLGYRIEVAGSPSTKIDKDSIQVNKEESSILNKIEEKKKMNKQIIKR